MIRLQDIERIERYLRGEFNASEQATFETEAAQDAQLAKNIELVRISRDMAQLALDDDLRKKWQERNKPRTAKRSRWARFFFGLFTLLFCFAVVALVWRQYRNQAEEPAKPMEQKLPGVAHQQLPATDTKSLPDNTLSPPPAIERKSKIGPAPGRTTDTGRKIAVHPGVPDTILNELQSMAVVVIADSDMTSPFKGTRNNYNTMQTGLDAVVAGKWVDARRFFEKQDKAGAMTDNPGAWFYYGLACFCLYDYLKADECFHNAADSEYDSRIEYLLLLSRLAQFGPEDMKFIDQLRDITRREHRYRENARLLAQKLKIQVE